MTDPKTSWHEANRRSWNAATRAHNSHKRDQAGFFRQGGSTLFPEEQALLGPLGGKRLVHLLCNSGQDSLSLARLGAEVVGVDASDEAVAFARQLSSDSGVPARFERSDVYDWLAATDERFDVAFSSYGAIGWLSDLQAWARGLRRVLKPGGRFVLVEFHPLAWIFDEKLKLAWPYSTHGQPLEMSSGVSDYVARSGPALAPSGFVEGERNFVNPHPTWEFAWGLGDVIGALLGAGLTLETLVEYPYSNGCTLYEGMRELPGNRWTVPAFAPELPLMYGLAASAR